MQIDGHDVAVIFDVVETDVGHAEFVAEIVVNRPTHRQEKRGQHL